MPSPQKLVLYTYWRSSSSYRVRFALAAKGLAYESAAVDLLKEQQSKAEHRARSPMGYVPCLLVDGKPFVESVAIIELIEELFPTPPLLPRDPYARAQVRALVEMVNAGTQPLQNRHVLLYAAKDPEGQRAWGKYFVTRGLEGIEGLLESFAKEGVAGKYAYGDALTMADVYLVPQLYNARRFHVDLTPFPRVVAAEQAALATDAAKAAAPDAQPDAPPA